MNETPSAAMPKEEFFGWYLEELEQAEDKEAVVRKYLDLARPEWAPEILEQAAPEPFLAPVAARRG